MKAQSAAGANAFLRDVLQRTGDELVSVIADTMKKTVVSMFSQKIHAVEGRSSGDLQHHYAAVVVMAQGPSHFRLRLAFDASLLKTLVASVYPLDAANSDETLDDVVAEVANIVAGHIKTFLNARGFAVTRDLPVVERPAVAPAAADGGLSLNFSIFRNSLAARNLLNVALL